MVAKSIYIYGVGVMKKKKKLKIIFSVIIAIIIVYIVMLFDTNSLMVEVKSVFMREVEESETIEKPVNMYNRSSEYQNEALVNVNLKLNIIFTIHNFRDGYIWAYYSVEARNESDELLYGSWEIPTKWKIHKENGKWEIVDIIEAP